MAFREPVLGLVSAVCLQYPCVISGQFMELVQQCFDVENREEYARVLPISSVLRVNVDALSPEELCGVFQLVIDKMDTFDKRIADVLFQRLFLSPGRTLVRPPACVLPHAPAGLQVNTPTCGTLLSPDVLVLVRNLFVKFPYEMYSARDGAVFSTLIDALSGQGERQQAEVCGIIHQLTYAQIIYIEEFRRIINALSRRIFLFTVHLDVIELIAQFIDIGGAIRNLIHLQASRDGVTQLRAARLLVALGEPATGISCTSWAVKAPNYLIDPVANEKHE